METITNATSLPTSPQSSQCLIKSIFAKGVSVKSSSQFGCSLLVLSLLMIAPASADEIIRTTNFEYNPTTGLLIKQSGEIDDPENSLVITYGRDEFGNKTTVTTSSSATGERAIETRTSADFYDTKGRFPIRSTNALGHEETKTFDSKTGAPLILTGPNGLTTTWTYDNFGRKLKELYSDGTRTEWSYDYCTSVPANLVACPANAVTLVSSVKLDVNGAKISARSATYSDRLGREIRVASQGVAEDGSIKTTIIDTIYNAQGQVVKKSEPYFAGTAPDFIVWRVYEYEPLGRIKAEFHSVMGSDSDGKERIHFSYNGLTKTAVTSRDDGLISTFRAMTAPETQTRITTQNSQGQEIEIIDSIGGKTTFIYDPKGNLKSSTVTALDASDAETSVTTSFVYNKLGHKTDMYDPDKGHWRYVVDPLGQVRKQTDANLNVTAISYDRIGRVVQKQMLVGGIVDRTDSWTYDGPLTGKAVGKLVSSDSKNASGAVFAEKTFTYDETTGRLTYARQSYDQGDWETQQASYDTATGRLQKVTYPSGLTLAYEHDELGQVVKIKNQATNLAYWTSEARNAAGQILSSLAGNNVRTTRTYAQSRGFLVGINSINAAGQHIQDLRYAWDNLGNMRYREVDLLDGGYKENFAYDELNRLQSSQIEGQDPVLMEYDGFGNILSKTDKGDYGYDSLNQPHAVKQVVGLSGTELYSYDANGNMVIGKNRAATWTSFNQPSSITRGGTTLVLSYDGDHNRIKQVNPTETKYYFADAMGANRYERIINTSTSVQAWNDQIVIGGQIVAAVETKVETFEQKVSYMHSDHLGSIQAITNDMGEKIESLDYDAWGARRYGGLASPAVQGQPDLGQSLVGYNTDRGFTGHEMLDSVGLVHMNGRIYDAQLARFLSADNVVVDPRDTQSYSRYSYVRNSPLTATDPSGWMEDGGLAEGEDPTAGQDSGGGLLGAIGDFFSAIGDLIGSVVGGIAGAIASGFSALASGLRAIDNAISVGLLGLPPGMADKFRGWDQQSITRALKDMATTGPDPANPKELREPHLSKNTPVAIVGGFFDYTLNGPGRRTAQAYQDAIDLGVAPYGTVDYFTWDQFTELTAWIDENPNGLVIGHSYGAHTAMQAVAAGHQVDVLATFDPVGWGSIDYAQVRENTGYWANFNAVGTGVFDFSDVVAGIGGALNATVAPYADYYADIHQSHAGVFNPGIFDGCRGLYC